MRLHQNQLVFWDSSFEDIISQVFKGNTMKFQWILGRRCFCVEDRLL